MKHLISLLLFFGSCMAFADLSSTMIPGVDKAKFELAMARQMDVHKVEILEIKELKAINLFDVFLAAFYREVEPEMQYSVSLIVDESIFNSQTHGVVCKITDFYNIDKLLVNRCHSKTSSVQGMLFKKSELF